MKPFGKSARPIISPVSPLATGAATGRWAASGVVRGET